MPSESSSSSSRHSLAHVNQWLNKQRSKSAHVPWSRRKSELSKKVQCSSPPQAAEEDDDNEEERYYYAQPSAATRRTLSWQPAPAYSKDISIPTRGTSKTYKLDPELQARIDQVIASEQMQMLAQRVQQHRKSLHSVSLQPPPPVPQHRCWYTHILPIHTTHPTNVHATSVYHHIYYILSRYSRNKSTAITTFRLLTLQPCTNVIYSDFRNTEYFLAPITRLLLLSWLQVG